MKKETKTKVRCKSSIVGRVVMHPKTNKPIVAGDIVDLPPELAEYLINRGDYEAHPEELSHVDP